MFRFGAPITMAGAASALAEASKAIAAGETELQLDGLDGSDSSAVAVLVACRRVAQQVGVSMRLAGIPGSLASLAKLYGVDKMFTDVATSDPLRTVPVPFGEPPRPQ